MTSVSEPAEERAAGTENRHVSRAIRWNVTLTVITVAVQVGVTMLLGRLLTAFDYGVFAFANSIMVFSNHLSQRGLSAALLQRRELHPRDFGYAYLACLTIFVAIAPFVLTAGWALIAYGRGQYDTQAHILMFLLVPLAVQMVATPQIVVLQRRFAVVQANLFQTAGLFFGNGVVGGFCAWHGLGAWSLAYGALAYAAVLGGASMVAGWTPVAFGCSGAAYRAFLIDAATMSWLRALDVAWLQVPLGYFGIHASSVAFSGVYQRMQFFADILLQMSVWRVGTVYYAAMAVDRTADAVDRTLYRRVYQVLATLTLPLVAFSWTAAEPMIEVLLGRKWVQGAWTFRLLMVAFGLFAINLAATWSMEIGRGYRPRIIAAMTAVTSETVLLCLVPADAQGWYPVPAVLSMALTTILVYRFSGERLPTVPQLVWLLRGGLLLSVLVVIGSLAGLQLARWQGFAGAFPLLALQGGAAGISTALAAPVALTLADMSPILDMLLRRAPVLRPYVSLCERMTTAGENLCRCVFPCRW